MKLLVSPLIAASCLCGYLASSATFATRVSAFATPVTVETYTRPVQIFDVKQGKITLTLPNTREMQEDAKEWIKAIDGLAAQTKIEPKDGIVIRIPLQEPVPLKSNISDGSAEEIYVFVNPRQTKPALMLVFTQKGQPLLVNADIHLAPILHKHHLQRYAPKSS